MDASSATAPFTWRRYLGIIRVVLGAACAFLHFWLLAPGGPVLGFLALLYSAYGAFLVYRDPTQSKLYPLALLYLDAAFFFLCLSVPGQFAYVVSLSAYLYLVCFASLFYQWPQVATVAASVTAFLFLLQPDLALGVAPAVLVGGITAVVMSLEKRMVLERLSLALRHNQASRSEADVARDTERHRIAGDFHDGPLQSFISFQMRLEIIRKLLTRDPDAAMQEILQLQDLGRAQVTELRSFVRNMQPADVNPSNLGGAIRETVEHFERDSGITAHLRCGDLSMVGEDTVGEFFQIVRESLNNVRKHSKAAQVKIQVEAHRDQIGLSVDDDGCGFPFSGTFNLDELEILQLGPKSIKRRVQTLEGEMAIDSRPSQGSTLRIKVPNR